MAANKQEQVLSWWDLLKQNFNYQNCINRLGLNTCKLIQILTYFGLGFFLGFLLKRYTKIVFISILFLILSLMFLESFKMIVIDWVKIKEVTGINPTQTIGSVSSNILEWIKLNMSIVVSSFVGFLIGYKLG